MYSLKSSIKVFIKGQLWLLILLAILAVNFNYWIKPQSSLIGLIGFAEIFIILLSLLSGIKTKKQLQIKRENPYSLNGLLRSFWATIPLVVFFSFSMWNISPDNGVPFPSGLLAGYLIINGVFAFASLFVPNYIIAIYLSNVYDEKNSSYLSEGYRLLASFFWSLNAEVQILLRGLPFVIQRLMNLVFIVVIILFFGMTLLLFDAL